jgi:anti-sigma B factor antagonist
MELDCRLSVLGTMPVLQVSGELDLSTLPQFRAHLLRAVGDHQGATLYVDVDGLHALDDAGLGMLLGAAGRAREQGGDLVLVCAGERLRHRFALTGLDRAVRVQQGLSG